MEALGEARTLGSSSEESSWSELGDAAPASSHLSRNLAQEQLRQKLPAGTVEILAEAPGAESSSGEESSDEDSSWSDLGDSLLCPASSSPDLGRLTPTARAGGQGARGRRPRSNVRGSSAPALESCEESSAASDEDSSWSDLGDSGPPAAPRSRDLQSEPPPRPAAAREAGGPGPDPCVLSSAPQLPMDPQTPESREEESSEEETREEESSEEESSEESSEEHSSTSDPEESARYLRVKPCVVRPLSPPPPWARLQLLEEEPGRGPETSHHPCFLGALAQLQPGLGQNQTSESREEESREEESSEEESSEEHSSTSDPEESARYFCVKPCGVRPLSPPPPWARLQLLEEEPGRGPETSHHPCFLGALAQLQPGLGQTQTSESSEEETREEESREDFRKESREAETRKESIEEHSSTSHPEESAGYFCVKPCGVRPLSPPPPWAQSQSLKEEPGRGPEPSHPPSQEESRDEEPHPPPAGRPGPHPSPEPNVPGSFAQLPPDLSMGLQRTPTPEPSEDASSSRDPEDSGPRPASSVPRSLNREPELPAPPTQDLQQLPREAGEHSPDGSLDAVPADASEGLEESDGHSCWTDIEASAPLSPTRGRKPRPQKPRRLLCQFLPEQPSRDRSRGWVWRQAAILNQKWLRSDLLRWVKNPEPRGAPKSYVPFCRRRRPSTETAQLPTAEGPEVDRESSAGSNGDPGDLGPSASMGAESEPPWLGPWWAGTFSPWQMSWGPNPVPFLDSILEPHQQQPGTSHPPDPPARASEAGLHRPVLRTPRFF